MLYLSTKIRDLPLLSLRSGGRIGTVISPIINPHNLHIDAFYCQIVQSNKPVVLLDMHIRDVSPRGIIVDDHSDFSAPEELIRLQPVMQLQFELENKQAVVNKKKLGKITDYAIDDKSLFIQKLYVQPRVWNSFKQETLTFDRRSVIEVTDSYVAFSGPEQKSSVTLPRAFTQTSTDYSASASSMSE